MKIALFTDTYFPDINGVATSCKSLRDILIKHGHQVLVICTNPYSNKLLFEDNVIRLSGVKLKRLYNYRLAGFFNSKAMKIIRKFDPDLVHIQTEAGVGIFGRIVAKNLQIPIVYTYHTMYEDYTYYVTKGYLDRFAKGIVRTLFRGIINNSDEFVTPSSKTKDYMRQIGIDVFANVIPTGVDFEKFFPKNIPNNNKIDIRKKFGINSSTFTLLSLGRIAKEKSIDFSIKCYARFLCDHKDIDSKMVIVGKGPYEDNLKQYVKELGISNNVVFVGSCLPSEVQNYYQLGDAFVSASLSETQGLTYMEAMAAHLYVMARYDHNLLDVIQDGVSGYFFENEEEFSNKLFKVYKLNKANDKTMLENAIKGIDQYSIETFYNKIIKAYKHVLKSRW